MVRVWSIILSRPTYFPCFHFPFLPSFLLVVITWLSNQVPSRKLLKFRSARVGTPHPITPHVAPLSGAGGPGGRPSGAPSLTKAPRLSDYFA